MTDNQTTGLARPVGRRTLMKGAAWSVPVVALGTMAPASAASPCLRITFAEGSCKKSGSPFGYRLGFCFTNNCIVGTATIIVTKVTTTTGNTELPLMSQPYSGTGNDTPNGVVVTWGAVDVGGGATGCTTIKVAFSQNSANYLNVYYTLNGVESMQVVTNPPEQGGCVVTVG